VLCSEGDMTCSADLWGAGGSWLYILGLTGCRGVLSRGTRLDEL
jgi:hypothetical protein